MQTNHNQNILILSAGRRVALLQAFMDASESKDISVITADMLPELSAACQFSNNYVRLPHVNDPNYAKILIETCIQKKIRLLIPTIDTELDILSEIKTEFSKIGVDIAVSSRNFIEICSDKRKTHIFFNKNGMRPPQLYDINQIEYPCLCKPYDGSLSKGIHLITKKEDIHSEIRNNKKNIYCEYLDPELFEEYTCDLYYNKKSQLQCAVPRLRLEVRGGEVSKAQTVKSNIVSYIKEHLGVIEGAIGPITLQVFRNKETGVIRPIEINARFGGGYPLTSHAGAKYERWLIEEYIEGGLHTTWVEDWKENLVMLRYDEAVFCN